MHILLDMDGVLADIESHFLAIYRERHPHAPFVPLDEREAFFTGDDYKRFGPDAHRLVYGIFCEPGFYRDIPPMAGAIEAMNDLAQQHEVTICTAPFLSNPTCAQDKYTWVKEHLGKEWLQRLVVTRDKTLVRGDLLIDDRPEVKGAFPPLWEHVIYDAPYNRHVGKRRLTWATWRDVLGQGR